MRERLQKRNAQGMFLALLFAKMLTGNEPFAVKLLGRLRRLEGGAKGVCGGGGHTCGHVPNFYPER